MGFRNGAYATVWEIAPVSDRVTRCRISISRKKKDSDVYEQDFSGFVSFLGTAAAGKAAKLRERDRIKLGQVDVSTYYDKTKNKEYINYSCYEFDLADAPGGTSQPPVLGDAQIEQIMADVDNGEADEEFLPY